MSVARLARKIMRRKERELKKLGKKLGPGAVPVANMGSGRIVHIDPKKHKLDLRQCPGCNCLTTHKTECPHCHAPMPTVGEASA